MKVAKLEAFEIEKARKDSRFNSLWLSTWVLAVTFGVLAIFVLLFSLFCSLVNLPATVT